MEHLFVHIADLHVGKSTKSEFLPEKLDICIQEINDLEPELVLITGDLTIFGLEDEYLEAKSYLDRIKPKVLVIPGNHDARLRGQLYFEEFFGIGNWTHQMEDLVIFGVDSSVPDLDEGQFGRNRQRWLENGLNDIQKDVFKIVAIHHHLVSIPGTGRERSALHDAGDVLALLIRNNVNLVCNGHRHTPYVWKLEDLIIATTGSPSCRKLRAKIPNCYFIIELNDEELTIFKKIVGGTKLLERRERI